MTCEEYGPTMLVVDALCLLVVITERPLAGQTVGLWLQRMT